MNTNKSASGRTNAQVDVSLEDEVDPETRQWLGREVEHVLRFGGDARTVHTDVLWKFSLPSSGRCLQRLWLPQHRTVLYEQDWQGRWSLRNLDREITLLHIELGCIPTNYQLLLRLWRGKKP
jgi:hypothetical protein